VSAASYAAAQLLKLVPRAGVSAALGALCEREIPAPLSRLVTRVYSRAYGVDMSEVAARDGEYPSFDAFFTRPLRAGARPIADSPFVSPADGLFSSVAPITPGAAFQVKGAPYDAAELLGDADLARSLEGGTAAVVYLSPRDYHRVHCPVDGRLVRVQGISGDLYPVNSIGERHVPRLFARNQRVVALVETESTGPVAVVLVGAFIVGRISIRAVPSRGTPLGVHRISPALDVRRGDELGAFHLGSTVVLLVGPGVGFSRPLGPVRYGEPLVQP